MKSNLIGFLPAHTESSPPWCCPTPPPRRSRGPAPPLLASSSSMSPPQLFAAFAFTSLTSKKENLSAVGGAKAKQFNYNPLKRIEFFCERKKTFSSFEIKKVDWKRRDEREKQRDDIALISRAGMHCKHCCCSLAVFSPFSAACSLDWRSYLFGL